MSNFFKDLKLVGKATQTIEALGQNYQELQSRFAAASATLQKTQNELVELKSKLFHLQDQQSETQEENELLLLQLHQAQVELEQYFIQYQDIKQQAEITQKLLNRVFVDNPSYFSYKKIECQPVRGQPDRLQWSIRDLFCASRHWTSCNFETILEKDMVGFVFSKKEEGNSPLTVWPNCCEHQCDVTCIPTGTPKNLEQRAEVIKTMSTSDWRLVTLLPEVLTSAIKKSDASVPNTNQLIHGLNKTRDIFLNHIPEKLRFDKVQLKNNLVHPDYEHLAFKLLNLSFGSLIYPEFEFRLGCSNVTKHQFGSNPKLEFPLVDENPQLDSWWAESEDDFGPKLEFRFAQPDAMDLVVWNKLKITDQKLISALIYSLAEIIYTAKRHFNNSNRSHTEWINMARNLQQIFALRTLDKQSNI